MREVNGVKAFTHCVRLQCGNVSKKWTGYFRLKTEQNQTEFEKPKPTQPYLRLTISADTDLWQT